MKLTYNQDTRIDDNFSYTIFVLDENQELTHHTIHTSEDSDTLDISYSSEKTPSLEELENLVLLN
jgi:hypothetical protein